MAVRKKGSRRIVVDGVAYVWRFPRRPTRSQEDGWPGVFVTANREDCPRASLLIAFPKRFHLSGPIDQNPRQPVLPSDVAAGIHAGIAAGWIADQPGKQLVLQVAEPEGESDAAADPSPDLERQEEK